MSALTKERTIEGKIHNAISNFPYVFKHSFLNGIKKDKDLLKKDVKTFIIQKIEKEQDIDPKKISDEMGIEFLLVIEVCKELVKEGILQIE